MAFTLMACYAASPELPGSCWDPIPITTEYPALGSTDLPASETGSCIGIQRSESVYLYEPDATVAGTAGTFRVSWSGRSDFGVFVRTDCADADLLCAQPAPNGSLEVHVDAIGPMRIFVSGPPLPEDEDQPTDLRSFALTVDFEPEMMTCGDGFVDPSEECDDGNTVSGDGCDAQCRLEVSCGDGVLHAGEECDDGNTVSGDGCDAQCRLDVCFIAKPVDVGLTAGDTSLVSNQVLSPCSGDFAPADVYVFTPSERGTVTFSIDPASGLGIANLPWCGGGGFSACTSGPLERPVQPGVPEYVVVTGDAQRAGPYGLTVAFEPSCGDGSLDPGETCDDHNRTPGDGCDEACQIELGYYCSLATPLALGDNAGDSAGGFHLFATCGDAASPQRIFTWTAPSKGALVLGLASAEDLVLAVADTCGGAPGACSNGAPAGGKELLARVVAAGQTYYVTIDGATAADAGPFTLNAQFVPEP